MVDQPFPLVAPLDRPPRPVPSSKKMAGYNPARAEFLIQYDNQAETLLSECGITTGHESLSELTEGDTLWTELCVSLAHCYRDRLAKRHRVMRLVKEQGLVSCEARFVEDISHLVAWDLDSWTRLYQVWCALDLDKMILALFEEAKLKRRIQKLQEYRSLGLKQMGSVKVYEKLTRRRNSRRKFQHLDIVGLPGYSSLCPGSRELCSQLRLTPAVFRDVRECLIMESRVRGGLRLAQARQLVKIDVNKTRKIYDFLIAKGDIKSAV